MTQFQNVAKLTRDGETQVVRYTHQPLTFEHNGVQVSIRENGKVHLAKDAGVNPDNTDEVLIDEIEIPAGLVFKIAESLRLTRKVEVISSGKGKD